MSIIGFIGAGQMAQALAVGIAQTNPEVSFLIADPSEFARQAFATRVGESNVETADSNQQVMEECETVFLAVKPQYLTSALDGLATTLTTRPLIVSVIAGVRSSRITELTGIQRVIRVMPNTPCLIGQGASAMSVPETVDDEDAQSVCKYLESVGVVVRVGETMLDSVTGLSGSGPAYVFTFIESLIQGAVLTGMPMETARQLAVQTVVGAAMMVQETGEHPSALRDRVSSPGGTTIAGLKVLEEKGFRDAVISAVQKATERSQELGMSAKR